MTNMKTKVNKIILMNFIYILKLLEENVIVYIQIGKMVTVTLRKFNNSTLKYAPLYFCFEQGAISGFNGFDTTAAV